MLTCLRVAWGNLRPDDAAARAMANDSGIQMTRKLWKYIPWAPRMLELLAECRRVRKILPGLQVRTLAFQSGRDELVSIRTAEDLGQNSAVQTVILEDSGHFAYGPEDTKLLQEEFRRFLG
jgi:pimeloyl-ACP methyl ester carboxylesterase